MTLPSVPSFALLLPETDTDGAKAALSRICTHIDEALATLPGGVSYSIGVATYDVVPESIDLALAQADACMYEAKARGKARTTFSVVGTDGVRAADQSDAPIALGAATGAS
jgi:PleD family two-component response regulator